jgi:hypothetical protein
MSAQPLNVIPAEKLKSYVGSVHVEGWNKATVFKYQGTDSAGFHSLVTPKSRKVYRTKNRLLYTRKTSALARLSKFDANLDWRSLGRLGTGRISANKFGRGALQ